MVDSLPYNLKALEMYYCQLLFHFSTPLFKYLVLNQMK